jgi:SSXT protein (N-terminal region)
MAALPEPVASVLTTIAIQEVRGQQTATDALRAALSTAARCRHPPIVTGFAVESPASALQMLDQNFEYIKVIADYQKRGMTAQANEVSAKLKDNLALLAKQAERQPPSDINQVGNKNGIYALDVRHDFKRCLLCMRLDALQLSMTHW